jgi:hypothetical protein
MRHRESPCPRGHSPFRRGYLEEARNS